MAEKGLRGGPMCEVVFREQSENMKKRGMEREACIVMHNQSREA